MFRPWRMALLARSDSRQQDVTRFSARLRLGMATYAGEAAMSVVINFAFGMLVDASLLYSGSI